MSKTGNLANHLIRAVLPKGGIVVSLVEVYLDESSADERVPFTTVAGYIFRAEEARKFNTQWDAALKKKGLPYFRMADREGLARKHGLEAGDMDVLARKLIKMLRHRSIKGISATVHDEAYEAFFAGREGLPSAYAFACFCICIHIRRWAKRSGYTGKVAYFFESGDEHQKNANTFLHQLFSSPTAREKYCYGSHSFVGKADAPALQGGDMLAWHTAKLYKNELDGRPVRKDLEALLRPQDSRIDVTPMEMARMDTVLTAEGLLKPRGAS